MTSETHRPVVISLVSPSKVDVITLKPDTQLQGPRLCATKFWKRWNFFKLLLVLCVAGSGYIYLTAAPSLLKHMNMFDPVISSSPRSDWRTYTPGTSNLKSATIKNVLTTVFTALLEVNETRHPSTTTTTTVRDFSNLATATSGEDILATSTHLATTATVGERSSLTSTTATSVPSSASQKTTVETTSSPPITESSTDRSSTSSSFTVSSPTSEGFSVSLSTVTSSSVFHTKLTTFEATSVTTAAGPREDPPLYVAAEFRQRLGNQMFTYAALLGMARAQNRTAIIRSGSDLEATFQITHVNNNIDINWWELETEWMYATFEPRFMNFTHVNKTISGYFQSWRYFHHNQDEVRREFKFKDEIFRKAQEYFGIFRNGSSDHLLVGVHVRRGDFLNDKNIQLGYGVPQASYFHNAFKKIRELFRDKNCTFLIASDDLNWCRDNLKDPDVRIVKDDSPMVHLAVLANCDHMVLSGGTFGWWAAWLNPGVKIYYNNYVANGTLLHEGFTETDYYPPDWIGLDN